MDDQQIAERIGAAITETGKELSIMQQAFVYSLLSNPEAGEIEAARAAGYANPEVQIHQIRRNSTVASVIRADVIGQFQTLSALASQHYRTVLTNPKASDTAKNQAAEAVLNRAGILQAKPSPNGENDKENKPLEDLSTAELEAMIKGLEQTKASRVEAVEGEVIEETVVNQ